MLQDVSKIIRFFHYLRLGIFAYLLLSCVTFQTTFATPDSARSVKLRSRADSGMVRLIISIDEDNNRANSDLELQRDDGNGFKSIAHIAKVKRKQTFLDSSVSFGTFSYRARLLKKNRPSKWSKITSVLVSTPAAPPQTPNPEVPSPPSNIECGRLPLPEGITECESGFEEAIVTIVNNERRKAGLNDVTMHPQLNCSSRDHTITMIMTGNFSHDGWYDSIQRWGYNGYSAGQNIALGFTSPSAVMDGWMNSPGHKANILSPRFRHLGVSCLIGRGYRWWTQDFGG